MIEFILDTWSDGWFGKTVISILLISVVLIGWLLYMLAYLIIDLWFVERQNGWAKVVEREYKPAHTTYTTISNGKTSTIIPIHHPERWLLKLKSEDDRSDMVDVSKAEYETIENGTSCKIEYKSGRLSGGLHITKWERI